MLATGSHLLIEKPLSHAATGVQALLQRVCEQNLLLQVGYNLRFLPSLEKFRELIHDGAIGRVLSVRCEIGQYLPSWRQDSDYRLGVSARQELGGGVLLELSHELDYLRWIFGEVAWVSAWIGQRSALEIDVEDTAYLTLGFEPDDSGRALVATVNLDFIRHDTTRLCTAIGKQGSLRWNSLRPSGKTTWPGTLLEDNQPDDAMYFIHSFMATPTDGVHRLADCVYGGHHIPAVIAKDNITGCQFHPEKSGEAGLKILHRFLNQ